MGLLSRILSGCNWSNSSHVHQNRQTFQHGKPNYWNFLFQPKLWIPGIVCILKALPWFLYRIKWRLSQFFYCFLLCPLSLHNNIYIFERILNSVQTFCNWSFQAVIWGGSLSVSPDVIKPEHLKWSIMSH